MLRARSVKVAIRINYNSRRRLEILIISVHFIARSVAR
jgi:hypothetical protein